MRTRSFSVRPGICIQRGFTYVELLITITISALLVGGLMGVVNTATRTGEAVGARNDLSQQARFAMQRMLRTVSHTRLLMLPMADNPATNWPEHIREETVPPSPPIGDSTKSTAVLAVTLPLYSDLDADGFPDADDDRDGRIDEDVGVGREHDYAPGIYLIDDDNDGTVDEGGLLAAADDDEYLGVVDEDPLDGVDNDGDGQVDEDPPDDMNADGCAGGCGVDDDADGSIDEGAAADDDEDGQSDEDWYNPVVFYLDSGTLKERTPVPWDETGDGSISGRDFVESTIAENVTRFRVERVASPGRAQLVDITLELTDPVNGESVSLQTAVRVGGAL